MISPWTYDLPCTKTCVKSIVAIFTKEQGLGNSESDVKTANSL